MAKLLEIGHLKSIIDKVKSLVFGTSNIADSAITTAKINNNAVTENKIYTDAVTTNKIKDANVTSDKLSEDAKLTDFKVTGSLNNKLQITSAGVTKTVNLEHGTFGTRVITKTDNNGYYNLYLISELPANFEPYYEIQIPQSLTDEETSNIETRSGGLANYGFTGTIYGTRIGGYALEDIVDITCRIAYDNRGQIFKTSNNGYVPVLVTYNSKNYLALSINGGGRDIILKGYFYNCLADIIEILGTGDNIYSTKPGIVYIDGISHWDYYIDAIQYYFDYNASKANIAVSVTENSITTESIRDGAITNAKLPYNIDGNKLANNSINGINKIIDNTITTSKIVDKSITDYKLYSYLGHCNNLKDTKYLKYNIVTKSNATYCINITGYIIDTTHPTNNIMKIVDCKLIFKMDDDRYCEYRSIIGSIDANVYIDNYQENDEFGMPHNRGIELYIDNYISTTQYNRDRIYRFDYKLIDGDKNATIDYFTPYYSTDELKISNLYLVPKQSILNDNSIITSHLTDKAITNSKLSDSSVSETKLQYDSVSTGKIQDKAITIEKIADGVIPNVKIFNLDSYKGDYYVDVLEWVRNNYDSTTNQMILFIKNKVCYNIRDFNAGLGQIITDVQVQRATPDFKIGNSASFLIIEKYKADVVNVEPTEYFNERAITSYYIDSNAITNDKIANKAITDDKLVSYLGNTNFLSDNTYVKIVTNIPYYGTSYIPVSVQQYCINIIGYYSTGSINTKGNIIDCKLIFTTNGDRGGGPVILGNIDADIYIAKNASTNNVDIYITNSNVTNKNRIYRLDYKLIVPDEYNINPLYKVTFEYGTTKLDTTNLTLVPKEDIVSDGSITLNKLDDELKLKLNSSGSGAISTLNNFGKTFIIPDATFDYTTGFTKELTLKDIYKLKDGASDYLDGIAYTTIDDFKYFHFDNCSFVLCKNYGQDDSIRVNFDCVNGTIDGNVTTFVSTAFIEIMPTSMLLQYALVQIQLAVDFTNKTFNSAISYMPIYCNIFQVNSTNNTVSVNNFKANDFIDLTSMVTYLYEYKGILSVYIDGTKANIESYAGSEIIASIMDYDTLTKTYAKITVKATPAECTVTTKKI